MDEEIVNPSSKGERAAMGGYLPQYDEFARSVYDCIVEDDLECIRVADSEDSVGKLDDICYVKNHEVHAYQVKWSNIDSVITYGSFKSLLPQIVDGWRKLKTNYPKKTVIPHLLTNKGCSNSKIKNMPASFSDYTQQVILCLKENKLVNQKWNKAYSDLKKFSTLTEDEWGEFWQVFVFTTKYKAEAIDVSKKLESQRTKDLIDLHRLIEQIVANPSRKSVFYKSEIIQKLGWHNRFNTHYNHDLSVSLSSYEPINAAIKDLNKILGKITKGYIFLKGTPGSGKSTLLTQWVRTIPNKSVRYYAFDFTNPSSQFNNDSKRGEATSFLYDIILMLEKAGFRNNESTLHYENYHYLKKCFGSLLKAISESYNKTHLPFIIIIDGLDHITREYTDCVHSLMGILPSPSEIPDGVIFVLGSQHFDNLNLNKEIYSVYRGNKTKIEMPHFTKKEINNLLLKILGKDKVTESLLNKCDIKSQGHPLYLRYIINEIKVSGPNIIDNIADYDGNIESYYDSIMNKVLNKANLKSFLGLLARIIGDININFIKEWGANQQTLIDFKNELFYLFINDKNINTLSFFHNSFKQYLLNKTAIDVITEEYDVTVSQSLYKKLADYVKVSKVENHWDVGHYLYLAGLYDEFLTIITPKELYTQIQDFRPIWHVRRDLKRASKIAAEKKDPYLILRYLLMGCQLSQMEHVNYSAFTLVEEFITLGESKLAKVQIREGHILHCRQKEAIKLARTFFSKGDKGEANFLFEISYPYFLAMDPQIFRNTENEFIEEIEVLKEWIKTAAYFIPSEKIKEKIDFFITYLEKFAHNNGEVFDSVECSYDFKRSYIQSLIEQGLYDAVDTYLESLNSDDKISNILKYVGYRDIILKLIETNKTSSKIDNYYQLLKTNVKQIERIDMVYLDMAKISQIVSADVKVTKEYLDKVDHNKLGHDYLENYDNDFSDLKSLIEYITLRAFVGYPNRIEPFSTNSGSENSYELVINFIQKVLYLAQLNGRALAGDKKDLEFISYANGYLESFDSIPHYSRNRYSYKISILRGNFYEYIVSVATSFGKESVKKLAKIVNEYFQSTNCKADAKSRRMIIMALFKNGADLILCQNMLEKVESMMLIDKDIDSKEEELFEQSKAWLNMNKNDKAKSLLHSIMKESFGIGYRKDYQPSIFAKWIGAINKIDSTNAIDRIHWLTSRLRYIFSVSANKTGNRAASILLQDTFDLNLSSGLKLAIWLLDNEFENIITISEIIIKQLLKSSYTKEEYLTVLSIYTNIHLNIDKNNDYDTDLLKNIIDDGKRNLGTEFKAIIAEIHNIINEQSPKNKRSHLQWTLYELTNNKDNNDIKDVDNKEKDYLRESKDLLAQAKKLLIQGDKKSAWDKGIKAVMESSAYGWVTSFTGAPRIIACKFLQDIDHNKGKDFTMQLLADDSTNISPFIIDNIDEILPLITEKVDYKKAFQEEFAYMNRILRSDTGNTNDMPEIDNDDCSVSDIIKRWLIYLTKLPEISIAERSKKILAQMIDKV